jgi:HPt (histidine-containing phosphotransfer) domain-containing protein
MKGNARRHSLPNVVNECTAPLLDLEHLRVQTAGDAGLAADLLDLFLASTQNLFRDTHACTSADVRVRAHRLRGAALAIGALRLAEQAAGLDSCGDEASRDGFMELEPVWTATTSHVAAVLADGRLPERLASPPAAR